MAIDVETTGLEPERDRIVEFAIVELEEDLVERSGIAYRVNPGCPIPPQASAIHGIHDEDVASMPAFLHHASRLQRLLAACSLVAYNGRFDLAFFHFELVRAGQPGLAVNHPLIDPLAIERIVNSHRLGPTYERHTGRSHRAEHNALADARAAVEVLRSQRKDGRLPPDLVGLSIQALEVFGGRPVRAFLDHGRRFYEGPDGVVRFGFGKHNGQPALSQPDYLQWMVAQDFAADTKRVAASLFALGLEV